MRVIFLFLALCGAAWPQALTEAAVAAAGGSVGGVAGKKVGEGVGTILQKVGQTMEKAAETKETKAPPALEVGPGVPKAPERSSSQPAAKSPTRTTDRSLVPPPPPIARKASAVVEAVPVVQPVLVLTAPPPPPPPPEVTPADLKTLTNGMGRLAVLKLGPPASRVTMVDAGHLLEIYRYSNRDRSFGVVKLSDGVVASVEVRP